MFQKDVCMKSPICRGVHDSPLVVQKALACLLHLTVDWHWLVILSGQRKRREDYHPSLSGVVGAPLERTQPGAKQVSARLPSGKHCISF